MEITFRKRLLDPSLSAQKDSVLTTWELSFQELSDDARHLPHMCAFLSNEDIPEELFRRGKSAAAWMMEDEERLDDAIESLLTFSLIKRKESSESTDSFWIHPLIHTWAHERTDSTVRRQNAEDAVTLVASAIVLDINEKLPDNWIFERRIFSRLNVCQTHISEYSTGSDGTLKAAEGLYAIASVFEGHRLYKQAEESYRNALAGYEKSRGKDHLDTLTIVHNMAVLFWRQGRYEEVLEFYQRVLAGREKALGKDHSETLTTVNCMALVFNYQGRYEESLEYYERAPAGREKALGKDRSSTLTTANNMALVFKSQGRYEEALEFFQRALAGSDKTLGKDHPETLATIHNMALVFDKQGRSEEALDFYQRTLAGREKALGKEHPSTLLTVRWIVHVFDKQERHEEAA
ncbi:hypothetical protein RUND412_007077 [Rhizina undulata]